MPAKTFAATTNEVKTMISGLKTNPDAVAKRGLDAEFTARMEKTLENIKSLDNEQETLKAKLKTKTAELDAELVKIHAQHSEAKKIVKMSVDQTGWREFGIEDKK